jgi:hypothetical protein
LTYLPDPILDAEEGGGLRTQVRVNEIDRRASALKTRLGFLQWLVLPLFYVCLIAMVVGLLLGFGAREEVMGGIIGIGGATAGFVHWVRQLRDEISELEKERALGQSRLPISPGAAGGQIRPCG